MPLHWALAFVLAAWALGVLLGHAVGYARAKRVRKRRAAVSILDAALEDAKRYVGTPS